MEEMDLEIYSDCDSDDDDGAATPAVKKARLLIKQNSILNG